MIRLIATDLDGTLLDEHSELTTRTLDALRAAMDAGCGVALSSGRMPEAMLPLARRIGVNAPMLLFNGAMIYDHRTDETLHASQVPYETALGVLRLAERLGIYAQFYPGRGYYCEKYTEITRYYENIIHVPAIETGMPLSEWLEGHPSGAQKLLLIDSPEGADRAIEAMNAAFPGQASFFKSNPRFVEIAPTGVDKGASLQVLWQLLGLRREEVLAFGDGQNDAPMLKSAGTGCAMGNACPQSMAAADIVAPPNTEDGVAQVIERLLREGEIGAMPRRA